MNAYIIRASALVLIGLGLFGCTTILETQPLINMQAISENSANFNFRFEDDREERFKTERLFHVSYEFLSTGTWTNGDSAYDLPLNVVFEKMFTRRFGNNPHGYHVDVRLKTFHPTWKPPELTGVPVLSLFVVAADYEWHGILKVEIAILDNDQKFIFHKIYDTNVREMKGPAQTATSQMQDAGDMLLKAFMKFSDELATDIARIRL